MSKISNNIYNNSSSSSSTCRLIVREIYTSLDREVFESNITFGEWNEAQRFRSARRRREWLSWRAALRESLCAEPFMGLDGNFEIAYHASGAPYIVSAVVDAVVDAPIYISVSHSRSHVAVLVSDKPCAVDMESLERNFLSVASRYLTAGERSVVDLYDCGLALGWCVKEMAYKYVMDKPLDFVGDIVIRDICWDDGVVVVEILGVEYRARFDVYDNYCIVWMS